jgi:hypothetical protein
MPLCLVDLRASIVPEERHFLARHFSAGNLAPENLVPDGTALTLQPPSNNRLRNLSALATSSTISRASQMLSQLKLTTRNAAGQRR